MPDYTEAILSPINQGSDIYLDGFGGHDLEQTHSDSGNWHLTD